MKIALMNLRILIQKNTTITDAIGNHRNEWQDYYSCYATISGEGGSEKADAGQTVANQSGAFTVRWCEETDAVTSDGFRILYGGEIYNITRIDHQNNRHKSLKFWVEKVRR